MNLDPVVQSAFVAILTWLLKLGADAAGIPLDEKILYAVAAAIVAAILSRLGVPAVRKAFPGAVERGFISKAE